MLEVFEHQQLRPRPEAVETTAHESAALQIVSEQSLNVVSLQVGTPHTLSAPKKHPGGRGTSDNQNNMLGRKHCTKASQYLCIVLDGRIFHCSTKKSR